MKQDHLQGTLELVILKTLATAPNHGFGITLHVQEASTGLLRVEEGSLYPALHRLEKQNLIRGEWKKTENARRARIYTLTESGKQRLTEAETNWAILSKGLQKLLSFA